MKKLVELMALGGALAVGAEVPTVSNVTIAQDAMTRLVTVGYTLSAPGIATLDILTNGVSIGMANVRTVSGDMNKLVAAGDHQAYWQPNRDWPDMKFDDAIVSAEVTAWDRTTPPDYCTVNIRTGARRFYTCEDALPGGVTNALYRIEELLMRRIPAAGASFVMGDSPNDIALLGSARNSTGYTGAHTVGFTNDYYIGVFEFTQGLMKNLAEQWNPSTFLNDLNPIEGIDYHTVRGYPGNGVNWPTTGDYIVIDKNTVCGRMRGLTGCSGWDLPTEAQWEFACRAGTTTTFHNGQNFTSNNAGILDYWNKTNHLEAVDIAWFNYSCELAGKPNTAQPVGLKRPNAWGLYDMSGNVWEWCRDWCRADNQAGVLANDAIEPVGEMSGSNRTLRGGAFDNDCYYMRSAARYNGLAPNKFAKDAGFRLVCPTQKMLEHE